MKRIHFIFITFSVCLMIATTVLSFNRNEVSTYGNTYWGPDEDDYNVWGYNNPDLDNPNHDPNSYYKNYNDSGGDCANFVSQCLIEGGLDLTAGPGCYGKRHINNQWIDATIPYCDNLHQHLVNNQYVEYSFIRDSGSPPDNLTTGDVIIFGNSNDTYSHAVIVSGGSGNNIILNAHNKNRYHKSLSWYFPDPFPIAHFYHIPDARVTSTTPENEATGVGIDTNIVINFSKPMNTTSVENAFRIYPDIQGEFSWSNNNRTFTFNPSQDFDAENYTVTILGTAEDSDGNTLDGDEDGQEDESPEDDYRLTFEVKENFIVSIYPAWENFTEPYESHTHYITITNNTNESKIANITMILIKASKCLSITEYPASTLEIPAKGEDSTCFVVTSGEELIPDDNLIHYIIVDIEGVESSAIQYANGQNIVTDHPDESYDISDPRYPTPAKIDSEAEVGVYLNGFVDGVAHLLGRFKEPVWFIDRDLEPLPSSIEENSKSQIPNYKQIPKSKFQMSNQIQMPNAANERLKPGLQKSLPLSSLVPPLPSFIPHPSSIIPRKLSDFKVLVIPSYGLSGVDTSEILEWRLRKYVEEGGVVVCFTQKYGDEFEFLPGTVTG
ncbi:MAG: amidase domain-containing protein, partial [bacterium]